MIFIGLFIGLFSIHKVKSQNPSCGALVPYFYVNFTGSPAGTWTSPNISRVDQCCGVPGSEQCISFDVLLDLNAAGIQIDMTGADPSGALFYSINCVGSYPGGTIKCISGTGLQRITFCKSGNNKNVYKITSISKPTFPRDDSVRIGCSTQLISLGVVDSTTNWTSIYPGVTGAYDSYFNCTNCASPVYNPAIDAPPYVDYRVCGFPQASTCGFNTMVCDTVRVYNLPGLNATITPSSASFCNLGPGSGVTLTASGAGGLAPYTYTWRNSSNVIVGTGLTYFATLAGNYTLEVKDALNTSTCPSYYKTVSVTVGNLPVVNAGPDKTICATSPTVTLEGTVQNATGGIWSGGSGVFNPGSTFLNTDYTPTSTEIKNGSVTLTLTSTGSGGGCTNSSDQITIFFDTLKVAIPSASLSCNNNSTILSANVMGGTGPFTYQWNNGVASSSINVGQGNFTVAVTDSIGCSATAAYTLVAPAPLQITLSSTDISINGGNDGTATAGASGGTPPYSFLWSNGGATSTIGTLVYGIYTITITDSKGCIITGSIVVNEPRCLGFNVSAGSTNIFCNNGNNGMAYASASGGTLPYIYSWNDSLSQSNDTAFNLSAGAYTITVKDFNNCYQTANTSITQPPALYNVMNTTNVLIVGGNTGSATANPFGGVNPYGYVWNNGSLTQTINNLTAGVYSVTVTDNNSCSKVDSVMITEGTCSNLSINAVTTNVSCFGGNSGSAFANVINAIAPYTINWSNGQTGLVATGLPAGNYSVTITDAGNCTQFDLFTITQPSLLSSGVSPNNISCFGNHDGTIDLTVSGGTFPYTFKWSNSFTNEDQINLAPGTYSVLVTDSKGCTSNSSAIISQPALISSSYSVTNVACANGSSGAIDLTVSGGMMPYTYHWLSGATTQDISGIQAGGYYDTITDANNCKLIIDPIAVAQPALALGAGITSQTNVFCNGGNTGNATVTASGGSGTYLYSWNTAPVQTTATAINLSALSYTVTVSDNNGCTVPVTAVATITQPISALAASITSQTNVFCFGGNTGTATVTPTGGSGAYSYSWNTAPVQTSATATGLTAGSYTVTVSDNNGCTIPITAVATITQLTSAISASVTSQTNVFCNGSNTGVATAAGTGGSGSYSYSWNTTPVQTTATASGLTAGNYTITVTDNNGCTVPVTAIASITQPVSAISASITSKTNVFCNGGNTGNATVTASGGSGTYLYSWNTTPVQTTATAIGLTAGSYTVTVSDNNGCTIPVTAIATITQPVSAITASIASKTNVFCNGGNTGSATVTATGGSSSYSYSWNTTPVQTSLTATGLTTGSYTVTVTDNNGCTVPVTAVATITQPALALSATISSQTNVFCFGGNTGTATVTPTGGSGAYSYSWNTAPVQTTATATGLSAGSYTVTVTDNNGCSVPVTAVASITQPVSAISSSITSKTNVFCKGSNTGVATVTATGGSGSYSYTWNTTPVQTSATATGLTAGSYTVTVTDNNGCTIPVTAVAVITQPVSALGASITSKTNVFCNGGITGQATVTATGGSGTYSYSWNTAPVQTSATAINLSAGSYTVTVTDNNGCTVPVTAVATITQPASVITASITSKTNVFCNGGNTGAATVSAAGGSGTYSYSWNTTPVQTSTTATGLATGSYTATVTDNNGCAVPVTAVATITQPASAISASITSQTNVFCFGCNTGAATVTAIGGSGSYSYSWNTTPAQTSATATGLSVGSYTVTVTDNNGCTVPVTAVVTITQPSSALGATITSHTNVYCFGGNTGIATVTASGGSGSYSYSWNTTPVQTTATATNLSAGSYTVTVSDNNGSTVTVTSVATITQPVSSLSASITSKTNVFCFGGNTGTATVTASGGSGVYSYLWNSVPSQIGATAVNLSIGSYTVTVSDNNGCTVPVTSVATITQPASVLGASITSQTNVFCKGGNTGTATATAIGGSGAYSYSWNTSPIQNSATATGLSANNYTVTVTDNNGCTVPVKIVATITQPASTLSASITSKTNVFCNGSNTGAATAAATGGSGTYSYSWNTTPIQTTATASGLTAGSYTVTVTDNNGCTIPVTTVATITQPASVLSASITSKTNVFCKGGNTGTATVTASGGSGVYSYLWNTSPVQTSSSAINLSAGSYTVIVNDNNGCTVPVTAIAIITQPTSILGASIISQTNVFCSGGNTGAATVTGTGGSGAYSYSWNTTPVQTSATATGLTAGNYTVTVTDNNGCAVPVTASTTITQPSSALAAGSISTTDVFCFGGNTGLAIIYATGGSGTYSYSWNTSPIQTSATATGLSAGSYTVTVNDNNGCAVPITSVITITQPSSVLSASITSQTNVFCFGGNTGTASVTASGGSGAYSYLWNTVPSQTGSTAINLSAGSYTVTVSDNNGCTTPVTALATITQPVSTLSAAITSQTNVYCAGGNTGATTITAAGGSGSYSYSWSTTPAQTSATAIGLAAGSYTVSVTDNNGCLQPVTERTIITEPSMALAASTVSSTNVFCFGDSTGIATANATGGSGSYSYSWNSIPVQTSATAIGLAAGSYTVAVMDNNGCTVPTTAIAIITQPTSALSANINSQTNVYCFDGNTGSATVSATGGSGSYTYLWNTTPSQIGATAINLNAGSYTVTITDNNGCTLPLTTVATITQPASLLAASAISTANISCTNGNNGSINSAIIGGTMPYHVLWTGPGAYSSTLTNLNGLSAGIYSIVVTDTNGCSASNAITLTEPASMTSWITSKPATCARAIGTADLNVTGGSEPYSYLWSNGIIQQDLNGVVAGVYTVNVIDANNCSLLDTIQVNLTSDINLNSTANNVLCFGDTNGSIHINVINGAAPYTYSWSNGASTENLTSISAGVYSVTVNDSSGCTISDTFNITQSTEIELSGTSPFYLGNFNVSSYQGTDGFIDLTVTGGEPPYIYNWSNYATTEDISNLPAGNYYVIVTDSAGCSKSISMSLTEPLPLKMPTGFSPNGDGKNDKFVVHGIDVYPNNHITIFNRWGNIVYQTDGYNNQWDGYNNNGEALPASTYFVILEINNKEIVLKGYVDLRRE